LVVEVRKSGPNQTKAIPGATSSTTNPDTRQDHATWFKFTKQRLELEDEHFVVLVKEAC
jgi:hypothetical protein